MHQRPTERHLTLTLLKNFQKKLRSHHLLKNILMWTKEELSIWVQAQFSKEVWKLLLGAWILRWMLKEEWKNSSNQSPSQFTNKEQSGCGSEEESACKTNHYSSSIFLGLLETLSSQMALQILAPSTLYFVQIQFSV